MPDVCRHVRTAVQEAISDDQIRKITAPICTTCKEHGSNFWLCLYPGCNVIACGDADGGQDHSTAHFQAFPTHTVQVQSFYFLIFDRNEKINFYTVLCIAFEN